MTAKHAVTDEHLLTLGRRLYDFEGRFRKGALSPTATLDALQCLSEGLPFGSHVIDCDTQPFVPSGLTLFSHKKGGLLVFDPRNLLLHREPEQVRGETIKGAELLRRIEGKAGMNACVLDYLLRNTSAIPDSLKQDEGGNTIYVYFTDTVYRDSDDNLYVRCLCWREGRWDSGYICLGSDFGRQDFVALLAS